MKNRNTGQTSGFLSRNYHDLKKESKKFVIVNDDDGHDNNNDNKEALLDAIRREQEADDEGDDDENEDCLRTGTWTAKERERAAKGIAMHGKNDYKAIAAFVKTRSPVQTRLFVSRN